MNKIDSTIISTIRDKYGLNFISFGFNNYNFFESKPDYGATFMRGSCGGIILINPTTLENQDNINKQNTFNAITFIVGESRAIYGLKYSNDGGVNTIAIDRLNDKIGTDKLLYILSLADKWYKSNLIDEIEKIHMENIGNAGLSYYSSN